MRGQDAITEEKMEKQRKNKAERRTIWNFDKLRLEKYWNTISSAHNSFDRIRCFFPLTICCLRHT